MKLRQWMKQNRWAARIHKRVRTIWDRRLPAENRGGEEGEEMLRALRENRIAKKTSIFVAVFAVTCVLLGNHLMLTPGEEPTAANRAPEPVAGQAVAVAARVEPYREVEAFGLAALPEFPFSGEYPAVSAEPLRARPLIEAHLPMPDGFTYTESIPLSLDLQKYTYARCVERGLEYELVLALMWRESRFQVDAVNVNTNGTRDSGIMQINDVNKGWLREKHGIVNLMDPRQNIDAGTIMLSGFTSKYGVHDGLMAYQYGEQGMKQKIQQGVVTNEKIALLIDKRDDFREMLQAA